MRIYADQEFYVEKEGPYILVNMVKYGVPITSDEGQKVIVVWKRAVEQFGNEKGFYIPRPLIAHGHLFEIKVPKKPVYIHYIYNPDEEVQRMTYTDPLVFVGVSKMKWTSDTVRIGKPKCQS